MSCFACLTRKNPMNPCRLSLPIIVAFAGALSLTIAVGSRLRSEVRA